MFNIKNISPGMWKFIIFTLVIIFAVLFYGNSPSSYYAYALIIGGIVIFVLGNSRNPEYVEPRTEQEARDIANKYVKEKIEMKITDYNIDLPQGELNYDGFGRHDEREGFITPFFEFGFHIHSQSKNYPFYYTIKIHGLKEKLEILDLTQVEGPYFGARYKIKYMVVPEGDAKRYHYASLTAYNLNKSEGFES